MSEGNILSNVILNVQKIFKKIINRGGYRDIKEKIN